VLLLHDADHYSARGSWRRTAAALPAVLEELERRGLQTVTL
jgi:peptidoglycan-N-acetylglucosamine deacetylase